MRHSIGLCVIVAISLALTGSAFAAGEFPQGVASGDVTDTTAIVWTRASAAGSIRVDVARDASFSQVDSTALLNAATDTDLTLKFEATGLQANTAYYYRFVRTDDSSSSAVGRFSTAPLADAATEFRFLYSGDSNAADQPFKLLDFARDESPAFWFWAGDTVYSDVAAGDLGVASDVPGYRAKHRQNRDDAALQGLLGASACWVQWDDHEVVNDYDGGDPEPGLTRAQIEAGYQAFFEYMPIRPAAVAGDSWRIYRSFRYGSLAEFFVLDCRQYRSADAGRAGGGLDPYGFVLPTFDLATVLRMRDPARTMLGADQLAWLKAGLLASTARWKFVLSSMPFSSLLILPYDRWDGYAGERYDLLRYIDREQIRGVVLVSADIHGNAVNPDVTWFLRTSEGRCFSPGFRVPEVVTGPIATETTRQEIAGVAAGLVGSAEEEVSASPLFDEAYRALVTRVALQNGLTYIEGNRYSYLTVDVTADRLTLTHKGILPDPTIPAPTLETLNSTTLDYDGGCGAGLLPAWLPLMLALGFVSCRRPSRSVQNSKRPTEPRASARAAVRHGVRR